MSYTISIGLVLYWFRKPYGTVFILFELLKVTFYLLLIYLYLRLCLYHVLYDILDIPILWLIKHIANNDSV